MAKRILKCRECGRQPNDIIEYKFNDEGLSAEEFVLTNEGTYNPKDSMFLCTKCYIKLGMPLN